MVGTSNGSANPGGHAASPAQAPARSGPLHPEFRPGHPGRRQNISIGREILAGVAAAQVVSAPFIREPPGLDPTRRGDHWRRKAGAVTYRARECSRNARTWCVREALPLNGLRPNAVSLSARHP